MRTVRGLLPLVAFFGLEVLEDAVQLTLVELVPTEGVVVHQFVVRAGPGQQASWYPKVSWLLVGDSGPLQVGWEWPGYDWVTAVFQVDHWDGETPLEGTIRHATDVIGYNPDPVGIRRTRVGCPPMHP